MFCTTSNNCLNSSTYSNGVDICDKLENMSISSKSNSSSVAAIIASSSPSSWLANNVQIFFWMSKIFNALANILLNQLQICSRFCSFNSKNINSYINDTYPMTATLLSNLDLKHWLFSEHQSSMYIHILVRNQFMDILRLQFMQQNTRLNNLARRNGVVIYTLSNSFFTACNAGSIYLSITLDPLRYRNINCKRYTDSFT